MKLSKVLLLVGAALAAFYIGLKLKEHETEIQIAATKGIFSAGTEYVKAETDVTKKWWNQLTNTWKQIWSK